MDAMKRIKRTGSLRAGKKILGYQSLVGRLLASILLPVGLLLICLWAPLALANDLTPAGTGDQTAAQQTGSSGTVSAGTDDSGTSSATGRTTSGSDLTAGETTGIINTTEKASDNGGDPAGGVAQTASAGIAAAATATTNNGTDCPNCSGSDSNSASNAVYDPDLNHYEYDLQLICDYDDPDDPDDHGTYWESSAEYDLHHLTVVYRVDNAGTGTAYNVYVESATANNGVTLVSPLPKPLGDLNPADWIIFSLRWYVPVGVGSFQTQLSLCAGCEEDNEENDDSDDDNKKDSEDNCPLTANPNQDDKDSDGIGDACDPTDNRRDLNDGGNDDTVDPGTGSGTQQTVSDRLNDQAPLNMSLEAAVDRGELPKTGFNLMLAFGLALGLMMPLSGGIVVPVMRLIRKRNR